MTLAKMLEQSSATTGQQTTASLASGPRFSFNEPNPNRPHRSHREIADELYQTRPDDPATARCLTRVENSKTLQGFYRAINHWYKENPKEHNKGLEHYLFINADCLEEALGWCHNGGGLVNLIVQASQKTGLVDVLEPLTKALNQCFEIATNKDFELNAASKTHLQNWAHNLIDLHFNAITHYKATQKAKYTGEEFVHRRKQINQEIYQALKPSLSLFPVESRAFILAHKVFDKLLEQTHATS